MDAKINEISKVSNNLYLITLNPPIPGFNNFIGVWLYKGKTTFIVDVGPSVTVDGLLKSLQDLKVKHLDFILLTHIHIDHAGGIGDITACFPKTPVICHKAGIDHLIDPSRLWEGAIMALGKTAEAYGEIKAVPFDRLVEANNFESNKVIPISTPGHSLHHISYQTPEYLFAGEAGGVFLSLPFRLEYLRPATPHRFFLDISIKSLDAMIMKKPNKICYGHFGIKDDAVKMLEIHRKQLLLWEEVISDEMKKSNGEKLLAACMKSLFKEDPLLAGFFQMDEATKERERGFLSNSIKGFVGHLNTVGNRLVSET